MIREPKYIEFSAPEPSATGRTQVWVVRAKGGAPLALGSVKWFGRWRCYAFFPLGDTVFERECLRDIAEFCEARTVEHRAERREAILNTRASA